ncbi:hypothetical protein SAMN04488009_2712 [Maribacter sedimenticola]|uniref:DUF748 domain-containing protein n=1 Tax=Maribacter sedimenticola TaxID=228956 RepID=A0ABY1SJR7_9FLAO|nr:hypothetical protein [Maribacter sedimenticola]SNR59495.1 hypothetical protein SAMN04488009_2712 [Maribacter sedimenticola]
MNKFLKWSIALGFLIIGGYLIAQWQMKVQVIDFLNKKIPNHIDFAYDNLTVNLLKGNLHFNEIEVVSLGKQTSSCEIMVSAQQLSISGFSYWNLFINKSIHVKSLHLLQPDLKFKTCSTDNGDGNTNQANPIKLLKEIYIDEVVLKSGKVSILNAKEDKELLSVAAIDVQLNEITTNPEIITEYIPFRFSDYHITVNELNAPLGNFEQLHMGSMILNSTTIEVANIVLNTTLSKKALSQKIRVQRDHIDLQIPGIKITDHTYNRQNDTLQVNFATMSLNTPILEVYRDKSKLEDFTRKPLYAEMLRNLPFHINIDATTITEATIIYEENIPNEVKAGALSFEQLNASIDHLSNIKNAGDNVNINIESDLMGAGKFNLNWKFNVHDEHNRFVISGGLSNFKTERLNEFLTPNLRTQTTGTIDQMYFTISGDDYTANGDIKMNYEDFKFQVLDKERKGVKKILSFIGNLFINDGSKADEDGFRYGTISTERVQHKSFFNYLWISLQDGLLDVLTGSGKKE